MIIPSSTPQLNLAYPSNPKSNYILVAFDFSLKCHPWITDQGCENKGNDHQQKKLLIVQQILLVNTLGNV